MRHYVSDVGSVLGEASNLLMSESGEVNRFPWIFTELIETWQPVYPGREVPLRKVRKLAFKDFKLAYDDNEPFKNMTYDDARWMARRIAQLSEQQVIDALVASGFSSAEVKLYAEKLASRRDRMLSDLGLGRDYGKWRPKPTARNFNYDPAVDGLMTGGPAGRQMTAPARGQKIVGGECTGCRTNYPIIVVGR
ncbi:MAG TPA: hypothetical protein VFV50_06755, partial [Bdellovibrionales bacterium]|nr:hypothetical protein [Bdellovibrionales bacterium]